MHSVVFFLINNYTWTLIIMLNSVPAGTSIPHDVNVIIEIPSNSQPVKYEVDKLTGAMFVDRFMNAAMHYPCEYGYIPNTLSEDGDPLDVLVISPLPLISGSVISVRPIGLLEMVDESGRDCKILAVPQDRLTTQYSNIFKPEDLGEIILNKIAHFFQHYKDLEVGKWVKINGWLDATHAHAEIINGIERHLKL